MIILVSGSTKTVARCAGGVGVLLTPANRNCVAAVVKTGLPWAMDNGAFSGFCPAAFRRKLKQCVGSPRLLWVACPDVVGDARATLALFGGWREEIAGLGLPVALVGQDGVEDCEPPWDSFDAWFVGGSTAWKLSRASAGLVAEARRRGKWVHMGRVNSLRRLRIAFDFGCHSVDGSGYSRFAAVARSKGRPDMMLERHLAFVRALERQQTEQRLLFPVGQLHPDAALTAWGRREEG